MDMEISLWRTRPLSAFDLEKSVHEFRWENLFKIESTWRPGDVAFTILWNMSCEFLCIFLAQTKQSLEIHMLRWRQKWSITNSPSRFTITRDVGWEKFPDWRMHIASAINRSTSGWDMREVLPSLSHQTRREEIWVEENLQTFAIFDRRWQRFDVKIIHCIAILSKLKENSYFRVKRKSFSAAENFSTRRQPEEKVFLFVDFQFFPA